MNLIHTIKEQKPLTKLLMVFSFFIVYAIKLFAQEENTEYYNQNYLRYENYIYKSHIKTVRLHRVGFDMSDPIIELNDTARLELSFDDFRNDLKTYQFTVIHCNANWQPSDLAPMDYIEGFQEQYITDYEFSFGTITQYTHYQTIFPNNNFKLSKSGNYILKVYADNEPDSIILSRRFMVTDLQVKIQATIKRSSIVKNMDEQHEIRFTVLYGGYNIVNPYAEIQVVLMQNSRWDNAKTGLKPVYLKPGELVYEYTTETSFEAGNEFRYFDIQNLRYFSDRIKNITYEAKQNHVYLFADELRKYKAYSSMRDINGRYVINVNMANNSGIEADYAYVHFKLPYDNEITGSDVYIFGELTNWGIDKAYKMKYNPKNFSYDATLFLKQGYYEYQYVLVGNKNTHIDNSYFEGSFYQTENNYTVYIYHRQPGTRYDQLIGVDTYNSNGIY